jgi:hypothetical protein
MWRYSQNSYGLEEAPVAGCFNTVNKLPVPQKSGNFSTNWATISFSRKTLFQGFMHLFNWSNYRVKDVLWKVKFVSAYLAKEHPTFLEPEGSLLCSWSPIIWSSPEPVESTSHHHSLFLIHPFQYCPTIYVYLGFQNQNCVCILHFPHA